MNKEMQNVSGLGLCLVGLMLTLTGIAGAAPVATDLNTGGTDTGFSGGWAGSTSLNIVNAADLNFANYYIAQTGTTNRVYNSTTTHPDRQDSRSLAAAMSNDVWFSVLVHVPTGGGFAGISFHSTTPSQPYLHSEADVRVLLSDSNLIVDLDGGSPPTATGTETGSFAADTDHLILGKMIVNAGNDTLEVWVDPDLRGVTGPGGLPAANFTSTAVDFTDKIVIVGVPGGGGTVAGVFMDAIWLSDTATAFYDVTGCSPPAGGTLFLFE